MCRSYCMRPSLPFQIDQLMIQLAKAIWVLFVSFTTLNSPLFAGVGLDQFDASLAKNSALSGLEYDEVEPLRGLVLHVELAPGADPDRADAIADELGDLFKPVEERFDAHFGGLEARSPIHVIVTVAPDTWRAARGADIAPSPGGADFLPAFGSSGAVVTYDLAWPGSSRRTRIKGLSEAFGEALIASHAKVPATELPGALIAGAGRLAGLDDATGATALTRQAGAAGAQSAAPIPASAKRSKRSTTSSTPSLGPHDRLISALVEGGFRDGFLGDVATLMAPVGLAGLWADAKGATTEARDAEGWAERRYDARVDQAAHLFAAALAAPSTAEATLSWVGTALAGDKPAPEELAPAELAAWTRLLTTEHDADLAFDPRDLAGPPAFEQAVAKLNLPERASEEVSGRPEDRLAEGLWLASQGQLEAAHRTLAAAGSDPTAERALAGIEALQELRASYLAHLADGAVAEKLRIDYQGKLLAADVTRVGNRSVFLAENTRGVDRLPITSIDIGELVGRMEKEKPAFGDALGRAWAQALVGGKWKRSLSVELKKDKTLSADLASVEEQLERGRVLHLLSKIDDGATTAPTERLAAIKDLLDTAASTDDVQNAHGHLEEVARELLASRFESTDLTSLLSATSAEQSGDTLTLEYDFKSTGELADWPSVNGYSPDFVAQFPELTTETSTREVDDKLLVVHGSSVFQHVVAFAGPLELTYELSYERTKKKSDAKLAAIDYVYASICDDLAYQHLRTSQFGNLDVVDTDSETNEQHNRSTPLSYKLGKTYELGLELDKKGQVSSTLDGDTVFEADAHGRSAGRLLFLIHSDRVVRLHSIKIKGRIADDQGPLREMWIQGQLQELGF